VSKKISNYDGFAKKWDAARKNSWGEFEFARELLRTKSIFDAGCGNGRLVKWLRENEFKGEYLGVDVSRELIELAKQNFPKEKFEIRDLLSFQASQKLDAICCVAVLHHLHSAEERLRVLENLHSSLNKDGKIFLTTWNLWQSRFWKFFFSQFSRDLRIPFAGKDFRHVHAFTKNELRKLLQRAGFKNIKIFYAKHSVKSNFLFGRNLIVIAQK
jgi:SAM-dependent methyltransferase